MSRAAQSIDPTVGLNRLVTIPGGAGIDPGNQGFLAPIDYNAISIGRGKISIPDLASPAMAVTVLTRPVGLSEAIASSAAGVILRGFNPDGAELPRRISWVLSTLEILVPSVIRSMTFPGLTITYETLEENLARKWAGLPPAGAPAGTNAPTEAEILAELWPNCLTGVWSQASSDLSGGEVAAIYGALVYTLIKTPQGANEAGFAPNMGRSLAASRAAGRGTPFTAQEAPTLDQFRAFGSTLVAAPALRAHLCKSLIIWGYSEGAHPYLRLAGSQARLFRMHGLGGLSMVGSLMMNWGHVVSQCRTLQTDIAAYTNHVQHYMASTEPLKDFLVALYGTQTSVASVYGDYSKLVLVARVVNGGAASMANFAGGQTIPRDVLEELRSLAVLLPNLPPI